MTSLVVMSELCMMSLEDGGDGRFSQHKMKNIPMNQTVNKQYVNFWTAIWRRIIDFHHFVLSRVFVDCWVFYITDLQQFPENDSTWTHGLLCLRHSVIRAMTLLLLHMKGVLSSPLTPVMPNKSIKQRWDTEKPCMLLWIHLHMCTNVCH